MRLVDSNVWIHFARPKMPPGIKTVVRKILDDSDVVIAEPVIFEVLANASEGQIRKLREYFQEFEILPTPGSLWREATDLGRLCAAKGEPAGSMDLLISSVAIHHGASLVTFDGDMVSIGAISGLKVELIPTAAQ